MTIKLDKKKEKKTINHIIMMSSHSVFLINALLSPLHPNISINFLHTVLYTFLWC